MIRRFSWGGLHLRAWIPAKPPLCPSGVLPVTDGVLVVMAAGGISSTMKYWFLIRRFLGLLETFWSLSSPAATYARAIRKWLIGGRSELPEDDCESLTCARDHRDCPF